MAWTWTGYDLDAVHRFKEDNFFQTGRNLAEDRFWKTQIHGSDRRGTQSSISLGERRSSVASNGYSCSESRDRSNSVISTISSRMRQFGPSRDYPYCFPEEISESQEEKKVELDENSEKNSQESKDASVEEKGEERDEKEEDAKEEEEEVKATEEVSKEESPSNDCGCSSDGSKERSLSPVKEEKEVTKEKTGEDDKNYKSNSIKISTQKNHIIAEKHISSRFY